MADEKAKTNEAISKEAPAPSSVSTTNKETVKDTEKTSDAPASDKKDVSKTPSLAEMVKQVKGAQEKQQDITSSDEKKTAATVSKETKAEPLKKSEGKQKVTEAEKSPAKSKIIPLDKKEAVYFTCFNLC